MRDEAAHRFALRSVPGSNAELQQHLEESASARADPVRGRGQAAWQDAGNGQTVGGFQAIAGFIDHSVPKGEQEKAAGLLLRMLEGATWDLWQIVARAERRAGRAAGCEKQAASCKASINAISDSFLYGSPVYSAARLIQAGASFGIPVDARAGQKSGVSWQPAPRVGHFFDVLRPRTAPLVLAQRHTSTARMS